MYYFVEERDGGSKYGYTEVSIEPLTGEVLGVVITLSPTRRIPMPAVEGKEEFFDEGLVRVDTAAWRPNPDNVPTIGRVDEQAHLSVAENQRRVYFAINEIEPVRWIMSGPVGFGIGASSELTGILAEKGSGEWAERLASYVDRDLV